MHLFDLQPRSWLLFQTQRGAGDKQAASVHSHTFKMVVNHLQALQWELADGTPFVAAEN